MASRRPPGPKKIKHNTPSEQGGCQDAIKIDPGALLEASGGEKNVTGSGRGASRKVLVPFFSVLSRPQGDFDLHFGSSWELQGGQFGSSFPQTPKPWILNTFHVKTLILRVPGGHFWSFSVQNNKTNAFGKKSAQVTTKINIHWLRDALGGASG